MTGTHTGGAQEREEHAMQHTTYVQTELARQRQSEAARRARLRGWVRRSDRPRSADPSER